MIPQSSIVRATIFALLKPRRLFPILVVCAPLVFVQAKFSVDRWAVPLGVLMCVSFVAIAPVSYRVIFPEGLDFSHGAVRLMLYALVGAGVVLSVGVGIPRLAHLDDTYLTDRYSLMVSLAMFLVGGWGLGRDVAFEQRVARLQDQAERAQLLMLKSHLDPHFLFNTLNAIAEWCRTDGATAEKAVLQLSAMLRTMLEGVREPLWPLARELELVEALFSLHLMRDSELFVLEKDLAALPALSVPPLCLLTLAENAVKHGPALGKRGTIRMATRVEGAQFEFTVENPGDPGPPREGSHGIPTLQRLLHLTYAQSATFSLDAPSAGRTRATLRLPLAGAT